MSRLSNTAEDCNRNPTAHASNATASENISKGSVPESSRWAERKAQAEINFRQILDQSLHDYYDRRSLGEKEAIARKEAEAILKQPSQRRAEIREELKTETVRVWHKFSKALATEINP